MPQRCGKNKKRRQRTIFGIIAAERRMYVMSRRSGLRNHSGVWIKPHENSPTQNWTKTYFGEIWTTHADVLDRSKRICEGRHRAIIKAAHVNQHCDCHHRRRHWEFTGRPQLIQKSMPWFCYRYTAEVFHQATDKIFPQINVGRFCPSTRWKKFSIRIITGKNPEFF